MKTISFPTTEKTFLFPGLAGNIELLTTPSENKNAATAIICHPHPLYGGTMHNKVVTTLAKTFQNLGLRTVRFNFRGVGKTEGVHDQGFGETKDLINIAEWIQTLFPSQPIWFAGFSFGGFVAARGAAEFSIEKLITIAPQVSRFVEHPIPELHIPWIVVQGEADEIIPPEEVYTWVDSREPKPLLIRIPNAGHFFHGKLVELRNKLEEVLS